MDEELQPWQQDMVNKLVKQNKLRWYQRLNWYVILITAIPGAVIGFAIGHHGF